MVSDRRKEEVIFKPSPINSKVATKTKLPIVSTIILAIVLALLFYQSFIVIPGVIEKADKKIELLACSLNPIALIADAVKEDIKKVNAGTKVHLSDSTPLSSLFCLKEGEMFHDTAVTDKLNTSVSVTFDANNPPFIDANEVTVNAKKDCIVGGGASCQASDAGYSCVIHLIVTSEL